jgi:hypothetical protein
MSKWNGQQLHQCSAHMTDKDDHSPSSAATHLPLDVSHLNKDHETCFRNSRIDIGLLRLVAVGTNKKGSTFPWR